MRVCARVCVCVCVRRACVCVCGLRVMLYDYADFLRFCVHIFVDLAKRSVLTYVGEIWRYRNDRDYYHYYCCGNGGGGRLRQKK